MALWCEAGILQALPAALLWHQRVLEALGTRGGTVRLLTLYFWLLVTIREAGACVAGTPWEGCTNPIDGVIVCTQLRSTAVAGAAAAILMGLDQLISWLTRGQALGAGG